MRLQPDFVEQAKFAASVMLAFAVVLFVILTWGKKE